MGRVPQASSDPFFGGLDDTEWNACIGIQGTEENYVDGYIEAAIELASAVIDKKLIGSRDTLAMPILYTARHGLELSLKYTINRLVEMSVLAAGHEVNHDVQSHWLLLDKANLGDVALRSLVDALEPFVRSLAQIDDDGQALRYPEGRDGKKSLEDRSLANISRMRASVTQMGKVLEQLKYRVIDLAEERATGSFTPECSRKDLMAIATMLPPMTEWREPAFDQAKAAVMARFNIGSRKFSAAVDVIKKSREMRRLIGLTTDLADLSDDHAVFFIEQWRRRHPPRPDDNGLGLDYFGERDFDAMKARGEVARSVNDAILETLSIDELADVEAIFQIGRQRYFGEHYAEILKSARSRLCMDGHPWEAADYLTQKTNLLDAVMRGLIILGRPGLAERLKSLPEPDGAVGNPDLTHKL